MCGSVQCLCGCGDEQRMGQVYLSHEGHVGDQEVSEQRGQIV
jgi:hypothetical protein